MPKDEKQVGLFGDDPDQFKDWKNEWKDMPEFHQEDLTSWKAVTVHFRNYEDLQAFAAAIGQPLTTETRSLWYPPATIGRYANKRYMDGDGVAPEEEEAPEE